MDNASEQAAGIQYELRRLRDENTRLQEELAQCQVDKEFVWSLWKKLQVASPDMTEAVSLVVEREKQKSEEKDRKVLDILKLKDDKISELQVLAERRTHESNLLSVKRLEAEDKLAAFQTENARILDELNDVKRRLEAEKSDADTKTAECMSTVDELNKACETLQRELRMSREEVTEHKTIRQQLEEEIKLLKQDNATVQSNSESLKTKDEKLMSLVTKYEAQVKKITSELKNKSTELETVRRELSDLWQTHQQCEANAQQREEVIQQLEQLHRNTERILKDYDQNQHHEASSLLQENEELRERLTVMDSKVSRQVQQIGELEEALLASERERDLLEDKLHIDQKLVDTQQLTEQKWKTKVYNMEREYEALKEKLHDKNRVIDRLSKRTNFDYIEEATADEYEEARRGAHLRSKSESGSGMTEPECLKRLKLSENKNEDMAIRLQLKETQLEALQKAHQRRLVRLRNLLTSYRLVREQLKVAEDELGRPPKKKFKPKRPSAKRLQQEDGEAAWNELRFIKNENKNLQVIRMNLEEQLDDMTVKASEDASTIHTLQSQIYDLQADLQSLKRKGSSVVSSTPRKQQREETEDLRNKIESYQTKITSLQNHIEQTNMDNRVLVEEKRSLKFEANALKKSLFDRQANMADLNSEINRLKRLLKRNKTGVKTSSASRSGYTSPVAQKYQAILDKSLHSMNTALAVAERSLAAAPPPLSESDIPLIPTTSLSAHNQGRVRESTLGQAEEDTRMGGVERDTRVQRRERKVLGNSLLEDEFQSETMSELASQSDSIRSDSAVSLGEVIARTAAVQVKTTSAAAQTSFALLPDTEHELEQQRETTPVKISRDVATSPLPVKRKGRKPRATAFSQVSSVKQRLNSLQLKVRSLTSSRDEAREKVEKLTAECSQLQSALSAANSRVSSKAASLQRSESELCALQTKIVELESLKEQSVPKVEAEQNKRSADAKIKTLTQDLSRRNSELKEVKAELESSKETNTDLNDRLVRLERDVAQKRSLLEDLRLKLRLANESARSELQQLEAKTAEVDKMKAVADQSKTAAESAKASVRALVSEKKDMEKKLNERQQTLTQKDKQIIKLQAEVQSLQTEMDSLQETARQQLVSLSEQGESAVSVAQQQLLKAHHLIEQFHLLIKTLSDALISRHVDYRLNRQKHRREERRQERRTRKTRHVESKAMCQAKRRAQQILDLSASDIDDLLDSAESDSTSEDENQTMSLWKKESKRWVNRWEKALTSKDFAKKVATLFMDKIDEVMGDR